MEITALRGTIFRIKMKHSKKESEWRKEGSNLNNEREKNRLLLLKAQTIIGGENSNETNQTQDVTEFSSHQEKVNQIFKFKRIFSLS